uniref:Predicted protein n=1 Tax=Hordeum vulgare subsp. vulgare TaxID=112509 RepID=F2D0E6_HORVV|nr:predicted protein [Hordeum vulgare subsp. vulgare]
MGWVQSWLLMERFSINRYTDV